MRNLEELNALCDKVGGFIQYWGFKKVDGTIWAHIFLAPEAISAKDLIDRLGISKAQVSISIKTLLRYRVIVESHVGDYGTTYYKSAEDLSAVIQNVLKERELLQLESILDSTHELDKKYETFNMEKWADQSKVEEIRRMTDTARSFLVAFIIGGSILDRIEPN